MRKNLKTYYFALAEILRERGIGQSDARRRYGFDKKGTPSYISRTGFGVLCHTPRFIRIGEEAGNDTINILCNGMGLTPGDLFRERK